jgi:deoxyribodipyrimidine photo-lyase
MSIAIHWFRRDLRLTDNTALNAALAAHEQVIPVYIASEWTGTHHWCGAPRQEFLCGSLASLNKNLEAKSARLVVRSGRADKALEKLLRETGASAIYFNRDPDPFGREMERAVATMAAKIGVTVHAFKDAAIHERDEVLTGEGRPFRVFTPYARAWSKLPDPPVGKSVTRIAVPDAVKSEPLPTLDRWNLTSTAKIIQPGEAAARKRFARFLDGPVFLYGQKRDLPEENATSRLSQDLRHGLLSIREVLRECRRANAEATKTADRQGVATFINELIWREFYFQVLWHWPEALRHEFQEETRSLPWRAHWRPEDERAWSHDPAAREHFDAWREGCTGFPIVDAGMRELAATGYMHNRVRMIAAMFLTKDLRIWWMHGESHFMRHLVDGEIASNNGGWQWSASTGTDAAPYFRIQNPWSQTKRFDRDGAYIKRWVPELRDVPASQLCEPPATGIPIAKGYPVPIVDHAVARDEVLEMFKAGKAASGKSTGVRGRPSR